LDVIEGFWAGAYASASVAHWPSLVEQLGGWGNLEALDHRDLCAAGISKETALQWCRPTVIRSRGTILSVQDERYPSVLRQVVGAPPLLFVQGDLRCLNRRCVAVVGTRSCTGYGASLARRLGHGLASGGIVVVSGLARGIDGHAHRGALQVGVTVAVLGHGLDHTSPSTHRRLRAEICSRGGAVVSSWRDEVAPRRYTFPRRNRWIAGMSEATVVVEAPLPSGALYTAEASLDMGRDTYAVPGAPSQATSRGCNRLIRDTPTLVLDDVDDFVSMRTGMLPPDRQAWLCRLFAGESVEQIARSRGISTVELLGEIAVMEAYGQVVRLPGQRYVPSGGGPSPRPANFE
jgi:DNA processing protein